MLNDDLEPGVEVAYVTSGEQFADALTAGPAAGLAGGALLLVGRDELPPSTADALRRLAPSRVIVVGGTDVVSAAVEASLGDLVGDVRRIAGHDRYATAVALSESAFDPGVEAVYLASGESFSDAIAAGFAAGSDAAPVLLVPRDDLPAIVAAELLRLDPARVVIAGGTAAVDPGVEIEVNELLATADVVRVAGATRYTTAVELVRSVVTASDQVLVTTGASFSDALAATPAGVRRGAPLVLLPPEGSVPDEVRELVRELDPDEIVVVGGSAALRDQVVDQLPS